MNSATKSSRGRDVKLFAEAHRVTRRRADSSGEVRQISLDEGNASEWRKDFTRHSSAVMSYEKEIGRMLEIDHWVVRETNAARP